MTTSLSSLARRLGRWPVALVLVAALAAAVLVPGLGSVGLWEPQERQLVDKVAPRAELAAKKAAEEAKLKAQQAQARVAAVEAARKAGKPPPPPLPNGPDDPCPKIAQEDALARTLSTRALAWGRDHVDDSDAGRRLPFALLALVTVLATAGIAMRTLGARAGLLTALVLLAFPLLVLQAHLATSDIGTACGASLAIYGLVALGRGRGAARTLVQAAIAVVALVLGIALGFVAGGLLLGALVPVLAYATSALLARVRVRGDVTADAVAGEPAPSRWLAWGKPLAALALALGMALCIAASIYEVRPPYPGMMPPARSIAGHVIAPTGCWSPVLGGMWKPDDDLRAVYDSTFEQIAYGTFPWGIVAPIAMALLLRSRRREAREVGALALAWAAAAWIAGEVFQRKVGFAIYAGFPALALAIGAWLDRLIAHHRARSAAPEPDARAPSARGPALLVAALVVLAVLDLGKDLQSFTERLCSLLVGQDQIAYPTAARLLAIPTRAWLLVLGLLVAGTFAGALATWSPAATLAGARRRRLAARLGTGTLAATVVVAAFWAFAWIPNLAIHLSSKTMFDTWQDLRAPGDQLVVMGDLGDAPPDYAGGPYEKVDSRPEIVAALGRANRVFAIAPQTELCTLHREIGGKPYFVLDDRNTRSILLTNKLGDETDRNPLATAILHTEPKDIPIRPKGRVVWDRKIELLGWDLPATAQRGSTIDVVLYYKILAPVGGAWTTLMHFDGGARFNGDHKPIEDRCPTSTWQAGDYVIDRFRVLAGGATFSAGKYEVWTGFFQGGGGQFKNMSVSEAPSSMRDTVDRVHITDLILD